MGSVILQAADHRIVTAYSSVMFHRGSITQGGTPRKEMKEAWQFDEKYSDALDDIIYDRVNKSSAWNGTLSREQFDVLNERSTYLRGIEAVEWGLADEVV
jgi:ATP-dependent protease ClpP protease subunit